MHSNRQVFDRAASFVLRIWWEEGDSGPIWRGQIQHAASGSHRYFQTIADMLHFVEQHTGNLAAERGEHE